MASVVLMLRNVGTYIISDSFAQTQDNQRTKKTKREFGATRQLLLCFSFCHNMLYRGAKQNTKECSNPKYNTNTKIPLVYTCIL
jgi:hypothetical protein